jgi:hypothetical protein
MKSLRLYDWEDKLKRTVVREIAVAETSPLTRNGVERVYVWTSGVEEPNFVLYPLQGTAYPEYDERLQRQRNSKVFLYDEVA